MGLNSSQLKTQRTEPEVDETIKKKKKRRTTNLVEGPNSRTE